MEKEDKKLRDLYFCGDIHGEWNKLIWTAITRFEIRNSDIIILGDFGIGFDKSFSNWYNRVEKKLDKSDITIYVLRGNHDDPSYFDGSVDYPRVHFLKDHNTYNICGRIIYPIGGANSTDVMIRMELNEKLKRKNKLLCWWEDEAPIEKREGLPDKVDIIISHTAPINFDPIPTRFDETPSWQYEKILKERLYLSYVLEKVNADYWFYGHYHEHNSGSYKNLLWKGLGIMEFYLAPEPINRNPQGKEE